MDRKSIIVISGCLFLILLWNFMIVPKLNPPRHPGLTNAPLAALTGTNAEAAAPTPPPILQQLAPAPKPIVNVNVEEELLEVTNNNAHYTFTSHGGGLKLVQLLHYPETISAGREKQPQSNNVATLNMYAPAPTLALLDGEVLNVISVDPFKRAIAGALEILAVGV